ncbi:hypothetical protein [Mangrovihabitans endophyticus]|uniref:hypothetical protein n=1 Tax=Mangrovihabitans endophyticus TaxID=1751298 RepID=UPI00166A70AF|nr:hypothetical protein [Mangrovihabitans endophyticus]
MNKGQFRRLVRDLELPRRVDVAGLCAAVGRRLGRPVVVRSAHLPPDLPSGLVIVTSAHFVIFLDALADSWLQDGIVCHELAHLLLGHHVEPVTDPDATRRILPTLDPDTVLRALGRTCYDESSEHDAEALGTALFSLLNPWPRDDARGVPRGDPDVIERIERALGSE